MAQIMDKLCQFGPLSTRRQTDLACFTFRFLQQPRIANAVVPRGVDVGNCRREQGVYLMSIVVQLDLMLARRKMRSRDLAAAVCITEVNISLLKSGKVKGVRFDTLERICEVLQCQPGDLLAYEPEMKNSNSP